MTDFVEAFQLDECLEWIIQNDYKKVALQLKLKDLKYSVDISNYLKEQSLKLHQKHIDLYITQSSTCCVDLLVTQHVSNLEALIHFGNVCLSKPQLKSQENQLPILFAFGRQSFYQDDFQNNLQLLLDKINSLKAADTDCKIAIFYDTCLIDYADALESSLDQRKVKEVSVAKLYCPSENWTATKEQQTRLVRNVDTELILFGHYVLDRPIKQYNCAIYLGNNLSINLALQGPRKLTQFDCENKNGSFDEVEVSKLLNKRIALISRLKDEVELKVGVIITNPLPNISSMIEALENYSKSRKHTLYFISMIQTIDECKIGNFDLCDAFVVANSCTCSTILKSLVFNRPIISELEFKLACGFEAEYGQILWPGSSSNLSVDDAMNKRKVSDVSIALVHTRNELLERCSQARMNKWSGMSYGSSSRIVDGVGEDERDESLEIQRGLAGIAANYDSEPTKK